MNIFTKIIAKQLLLPQDSVDNTLKLLDEGCTIPFISRYRKERTGGLNEVQIAQISDLNEKLKETLTLNLVKRIETHSSITLPGLTLFGVEHILLQP